MWNCRRAAYITETALENLSHLHIVMSAEDAHLWSGAASAHAGQHLFTSQTLSPFLQRYTRHMLPMRVISSKSRVTHTLTLNQKKKPFKKKKGM